MFEIGSLRLDSARVMAAIAALGRRLNSSTTSRYFAHRTIGHLLSVFFQWVNSTLPPQDGLIMSG